MFLLFCNIIIILNLHQIVIANPMVGQNVRFANPGEFPSVVAIKVKNDSREDKEKDHMCTGVLITRQDVLTAAHCELSFHNKVPEIIVGTNDLRGGLSFAVRWWMTFLNWITIKNKQPEYQEKDIAIIRLREAVPETVPIPKRGTSAYSRYFRKTVTAAAFGSNATHQYTRLMQTVDLQILTKTQCQDKIFAIRAKKFRVVETVFCVAADPHALMTHGNSGCPLFYKKSLIGINKGLCPNLPDQIDPRHINIFLSVLYYKEFIDDVISNY